MSPAEVTAWLRDRATSKCPNDQHNYAAVECGLCNSTGVYVDAKLFTAANLIESLTAESVALATLQRIDDLNQSALRLAGSPYIHQTTEGIEWLIAERDALAGMVLAKDEALRAANTGIEQIHDDWLEPESWNSAGCGQAAAHCLNISLAIDTALALTLHPAVAQVQEWRECRDILAQLLRVEPDTKEEFELIKRGSQLTGTEAWPQAKPAGEAENASK